MRNECRGGSRGSVFLLAMVALVTLMLLGTSLVQVAIGGLARASREQKRVQALALAEAGIEMAFEKLYDNYDGAKTAVTVTPGYYTETLNLPEGTVTYTASAPYAGMAHTGLIVSSAVTNTNYHETVRVIARLEDDPDRVFKGAIFCDDPLTLRGGGSVLPNPDTGLGGNIYANGDITFTTTGGSFTMDPSGSIYSTSFVHNEPPEVQQQNIHEEIAPILMPAIDLNFYKTYPGVTIVNPPGGTAYFVEGTPTNNKQYSLDNVSGVYYVKGDVSISGHYTGRAVIVATGTITITGNVTATNPDVDTIAFISPKSVKINGNPEVWGLIYAHGFEADIGVGGNPFIHGAVVADRVSGNGTFTVEYNDVWLDLPIPGKGQSQWQQISWEELFPGT